MGGAVASTTNLSTGLQTVDYKYNIRGWLISINQDANNDNDLFNFGIQYNNPTDQSKALYNGNISQTNWNTLNTDTSIKTYTYSYDALNRITDAVSDNADYNLNNVSYDKNGNILALTRNGHTNADATSFGVMDKLEYFYDAGNKLEKVVDESRSTQGFKDGTNTGNDYVYDLNGNMIRDENKGITNIEYNHLSLPTRVTIQEKYINYIYDATGTKLSKSIDRGSENEITYYAGNYIYKKEAGRGTPIELQFFNHAEGYIQNNNGNFNYVYQYKDHLGNVRLSYADTNGNYQNIINDSFSDSFGDWKQNRSTNYALVDGRLKANVMNSWEGVKHYLNGFTTTAGEVLKVKVTFDKGNTQSNVRLYLHEVDPNGNLVAYNTKTGNLQTGTHQYSHTMVNTGNHIIFRIDKDNTNTSSETYFYIDHVSLTQNDLEIIEESNYYPFGLKHKGYNNGISANGNSTAQKFKYNGKELEEGLGYDMYEYGARHYDPALGRFVILDRLSEDYSFQTPYAYAANNPVIYIDKNGDGPILGIIGAFAGAIVEAGSQVAGAMVTGSSFSDAVSNIDYADVGIAAVEYGVAGLTNGASLAIGAVVSDVAKAAIDMKSDGKISTVVNGKSPLKAGVELIVGKVAGDVLGGVSSKISNKVSGATENLVGKVSKKLDDTFNSSSSSLSSKTSAKDLKLDIQGAENLAKPLTDAALNAVQGEITKKPIVDNVENDY